MAEFGMWGPAQSGERMAVSDQQDVMQGDLKALQTAGQIGLQPSQRAVYDAHARLYGAEAAEKEAMARARTEIPAQLNQLGLGGGGDNTPDAYFKRQMAMSRLLGERGLWDQAHKVAEGAAHFEQMLSSEEARRSATAGLQLSHQSKQLDEFGRLAGGVSDQASLDNMLMISTQMMSGLDDPKMRAFGLQLLQRIPRTYGAEAKAILKQLEDSTIAAKDKVNEQLRQMGLDLRESNLTRKAEGDDLRRRLGEAELANKEARLEAMQRNGNRAPHPQNEVEPARDLIRQQLGLKVDEKIPGLDAGAVALADNAIRLKNNNQQLTFAQALAQSFDPKDWDTVRNFKSYGGMIMGDKQYVGGASRNTARPLPPKGTTLEAGRWYAADGKVHQWTGKGWVD